jgi:hypothetical protein
MKLFSSALEQHLTALVPEHRAEALILAADYCLKVRLNSRDPGTFISMALLEPGDLRTDACKSLYRSLESLYLKASKEKVSSAQTRHFAKRHGKQLAADYKMVTELSFKLSAIGYGILMTRLSYRLERLQAKINLMYDPPSAYTRIAKLLRECCSHIHSAAVRYNQRAAATTPDQAWSDDAATFIENSASLIARSYPA